MKKIIKKIYRKLSGPNKASEKAKRHGLVGLSGVWKMKQKFQIDFLKNQALKPEHSLIDIGCGTLRGGIPIIQYLDVGKYYGVDIRELAIQEAHAELKDENLTFKKPTLVCFDEFKELQFSTKFDFMFAFSVLIHLEDSIAKACFQFVAEYLSENGVFYANVNLGSNNNLKWQEFPVMFKDISFYEDLGRAMNLSVNSLGTLRELGHESGDELSDNQMMLEIRKL